MTEPPGQYLPGRNYQARTTKIDKTARIWNQGRTAQKGQDSHDRRVETGQPEQDRQKGLPEQDKEN
jgi:hypothetical protein